MKGFDDSYRVVNLAREVRPGDIVFTGVNSTLPMLACLLAKRSYDYGFTYINVAGGVDPDPDVLPTSSSGPELLHGSAAIFANEDFYDLCTRGGLDLVYLGAAQMDANGHANVSAIGSWERPKVRLPGGGGAAVMMPTARRSVVFQADHSPRSLVERVDFATAAGAEAVVTPVAVLRRPSGGRFRLESFHPGVDVEQLRRETGFELDADGACPTEPPTDRELAGLADLASGSSAGLPFSNHDFAHANQGGA